MRPGMQLSFLFACDDVALRALELDPDSELARVVPADEEVPQRAVLHDVECSLESQDAQSGSPSVCLLRRFLGGNGRGNAATRPRAPLCISRRLVSASKA